MPFKPKKGMVKHALDSLVIDILLEPSHTKLSSFKVVLDKFEEMGYNLNEYTKIYKELKKDYERKQEKWKERL